MGGPHGGRPACGRPGPAGFDPLPLLEQGTIPGIWLYGGADCLQPTVQDVAVLHRLQAKGKCYTVVVYAKAGHGLLDVPPTDPRALPTVVGWILRQVGRS